MHPEIHAEIMKARTGDAHHAADRARLARAVEQGSPAPRRDDTRRLLPRLRLWPVLRWLARDRVPALPQADSASSAV